MHRSLKNKKKWLLSCSYNPPKALIGPHMAALSQGTDLYTSKYEHLLFLGDFNAGIEDTSIKNFCNSFNLTSMVNKSTCYKNSNKPSCIDLILTNHPRSFRDSYVLEKQDCQTFTGWLFLS